MVPKFGVGKKYTYITVSVSIISQMSFLNIGISDIGQKSNFVHPSYFCLICSVSLREMSAFVLFVHIYEVFGYICTFCICIFMM